MSYTNPKIYVSDPLAFSKGFESSFDKFQGMFEQQKAERQQEFEQEKAEKERLKRDQDLALAKGYAAVDIGKINNVDLKLNQGLQDALNGVVESGQFANATPAEQQKMLQELQVLKASMQRIGEIASIDPDNWDSRNSNLLTAFRTAIINGDDSIEVVGEGLNMKIKGNFGEMTLDDISNFKVMTKNKYQDVYDEFKNNFVATAEKRITQVAKIGGDVEAEKQRIREDYKKLLRAQGPELLSYLYSNEVDDNVHESNKSFVYADPRVLETLSDKEKDAFISDQFNSLADNMYNKAMDTFIDPTPYIAKPTPEPNYALAFSSQLGGSIGYAPETYFNRLSATSGYSDINLNNDLTITYNRPVEIEDEKGNIKTQQKREVLDLKNPGDLETFARSTFEQFGGKDIPMADRPQAYLSFKDSLMNSLNQKLIENQKIQSQQQTTGIMQDKITQPQQASVKPVKEQILEIETFKQDQKLTPAEKRKMTTGTDKKIIAELNKQKLPITYANIDRVSKFLNINEISDVRDTFFGRTRSIEELSAVAQAL